MTVEPFAPSMDIGNGVPESENRLNSDPELKDDSFYSSRPFEQIFRSTVARILDFLIAYREFDYSEAEISRKTSLSYKTVTKAVSSLLEQELIKENRKMGRSSMYKISDSDRAQILIQFFDVTNASRIDRM